MNKIYHLILPTFIFNSAIAEEIINLKGENYVREFIQSPFNMGKVLTRAGISARGSSRIDNMYDGSNYTYLIASRGDKLIYVNKIELTDKIIENNTEIFVTVLNLRARGIDETENKYILVAYDKATESFWGSILVKNEPNQFDTMGYETNANLRKFILDYINKLKVINNLRPSITTSK